MKNRVVAYRKNLKLVLNSIRDGILTIDINGNINDTNRRMNKMYGYVSGKSLVGQNMFKYIAEADRRKLMQKIKENRAIHSGKYLCLKDDGSVFSASLTLNPISGSNGETNGYLIVVNDNIERQRLEDEIKRYNNDLIFLSRISQTLSKSKNIKTILERSLSGVLNGLNLSAGILCLINDTDEALSLSAYRGINTDYGKTLCKLFTDGNMTKKIRKIKHAITTMSLLDVELLQDGQKTLLQQETIKYMLSVPLVSGGSNIGVLSVFTGDHGVFSKEDKRLLETIGVQIGVAVDNARLIQKISEQSLIDELTGLYNRRYFYTVLETEMYRAQRNGTILSLVMLDVDRLKKHNDKYGHISGDTILKSLAKSLKKYLRKTDMSFRIGGDEFAVVLLEADAEKARKVINRIKTKWAEIMTEEFPGSQMATGISAGIAEFPRNAETKESLVFLADAALYYSKRKGISRCTLVSELEGLSLGSQLSKGVLDQVYAILTTVDAKESFGLGHFKKVASLSRKIGKEMHLSNKELEELHAAALLHDIGKIGVSMDILTKPDKLTSQEWEIIKKHSSEGAKIISQIGRIANLAPMIRHHHERFDGTGYPDKLSGEAIPLGSRIICLADAFVSMVTPRPYKGQMPYDEALKELEQFSGTQFDPEVVKATKTVLANSSKSLSIATL